MSIIETGLSGVEQDAADAIATLTGHLLTLMPGTPYRNAIRLAERFAYEIEASRPGAVVSVEGQRFVNQPDPADPDRPFVPVGDLWPRRSLADLGPAFVVIQVAS